ncbi:hypothetical protein [Robertmurraya andreesenii]|uniref:Transposase n=1 Tax=Anoxybacillus andreesenii TaxID=1325932 RepID=A0ABT9V198_9BACL|nr:hypothetical protein [Robertmurraya andreesenii]MDQ0154650.1 hypothetical protein [Robertmurraya andreesenii]
MLSNLESERRWGREEEKNDIAIEILKEGIPINMIEKVTKLSLSEIERLKKQL